MILYEVSKNFDRIQLLEFAVKKTTEKFYILENGDRLSRITNWRCYFENFQEAKQYLIDNFKKKVSGLRQELENAEKRLAIVESLQQNNDI